MWQCCIISELRTVWQISNPISKELEALDFSRVSVHKAIVFTGKDLVHSDDCWDDERYIPRFCTSHTEVITSYEDEWEQTDNYPIQFCPHCGEKIEISVVEEIDVSYKYNELSKQRKELWKKCQRTDSKKKEVELREQVRKLDKQIDSFYWLDEWKEDVYV